MFRATRPLRLTPGLAQQIASEDGSLGNLSGSSRASTVNANERAHLRYRPDPSRAAAREDRAHSGAPRGRPLAPARRAGGRRRIIVVRTTCRSASARGIGCPTTSTRSSRAICVTARDRCRDTGVIVSPADGRVESMGPVDRNRNFA